MDICTPHPFHAEQAVKAAEAKKHLIIEKPMAIDFEDCRRMVKAVRKNGVKTSVCFECRFISVTKATKALVDQGQIGEIYYTECDYFHGIGPWYGQFAWNVKKDFGGSSLLTAGIHSLDTLLYIAGGQAGPVEEVFSYPTTNPHEVYKPYEYPTTSVTLLKFANGRTLGKCASVTDAMQPYVFNMNFVGLPRRGQERPVLQQEDPGPAGLDEDGRAAGGLRRRGPPPLQGAVLRLRRLPGQRDARPPRTSRTPSRRTGWSSPRTSPRRRASRCA